MASDMPPSAFLPQFTLGLHDDDGAISLLWSVATGGSPPVVVEAEQENLEYFLNQLEAEHDGVALCPMSPSVFNAAPGATLAKTANAEPAPPSCALPRGTPCKPAHVHAPRPRPSRRAAAVAKRRMAEVVAADTAPGASPVGPGDGDDGGGEYTATPVAPPSGRGRKRKPPKPAPGKGRANNGVVCFCGTERSSDVDKARKLLPGTAQRFEATLGKTLDLEGRDSVYTREECNAKVVANGGKIPDLSIRRNRKGYKRIPGPGKPGWDLALLRAALNSPKEAAGHRHCVQALRVMIELAEGGFKEWPLRTRPKNDTDADSGPAAGAGAGGAAATTAGAAAAPPPGSMTELPLSAPPTVAATSKRQKLTPQHPTAAHVAPGIQC